MALACHVAGSALALMASSGSKSSADNAPADWRSRASSRSICTGASTITLTCGKVCVSALRTLACLAVKLSRSCHAHRFNPSRWASSSTATPQRAARHCGACSRALARLPALRSARVRPELAKSNCAKSHSPRAARRARLLWVSSCTGRPTVFSASAATAGSACTGAGLSASACKLTKASAAPDSGSTTTPKSAP